MLFELNFGFRKSIKSILQAENSECALACVAMISSYYGNKHDINSIRAIEHSSSDGMSLSEVARLCKKVGLNSRPLKCPTNSLPKISLPAIILWENNHYVVLDTITSDSRSIYDPAKGLQTLSIVEFEQSYSGILLEITKAIDFTKNENRVQLRLNQLWSSIIGFKRSLAMLIALSFFIQFFGLISPYYMQLVVDKVLSQSDSNLLFVLATGFAVITIMNSSVNLLRGWAMVRMASLLSYQIGNNIFCKLLDLPMEYFQNRHIGDISSRFSSLNKIRERLTSGIVETFVDGFLGLAVLGVMFLYSNTLTFVFLAFLALYVLFRLCLYRPFELATEGLINSSATEQSNFLESIKGIQTVKLFSAQSDRLSMWQHYYSEVVSSDAKLGFLKTLFDSSNKLLFGLENIVVIYVGSSLIIDGNMSLGMLLAFIAYKNQLTQKSVNVVEQLFLFRMLKIHLNRLSDIVFQSTDNSDIGLKPVKGCLSVRFDSVGFKYKGCDSYIFRNLSFDIEGGESVAIVGKSGCGKSTVVKIMLGLLQPTEGRVFINGQDIKTVNLSQLRETIGTVMQDDTLFAGTIKSNISFFGTSPSHVRVVDSAQKASIYQDIISRPMGFDTLVGDMGSSLSGGQRQRVLLARALYREPKLLVLDEATSHLDTNNESIVNDNLKNLDMTRIIIAHRESTISSADRVINLNSL